MKIETENTTDMSGEMKTYDDTANVGVTSGSYSLGSLYPATPQPNYVDLSSDPGAPKTSRVRSRRRGYARRNNGGTYARVLLFN